jgi:hypothetical protein
MRRWQRGVNATCDFYAALRHGFSDKSHQVFTFLLLGATD